ncbi:hypothetical protein [Streptomyces sp. NPDC050759]|uniref:hypothetical protein n=1 Tax=Streptomyces sp. NPDC050759 TaxID=3365635 RepID=UPI0037BA4F8B
MKERLFPRIGALAGVTVGVAALLLPLTASPAAALGGRHKMAMASRSDVQSIFVGGRGGASWQAPGLGGGYVEGLIDACYMYKNNTGGWVKQDEGFQVYLNQGRGKQGVGEAFQHASPLFDDNAAMTIATFTSSDCTTGIQKQRRLTVPSDNLQYFWVDLR